jgi:glycosyltransferase involved in cell wall biosynthesis
VDAGGSSDTKSGFSHQDGPTPSRGIALVGADPILTGIGRYGANLASLELSSELVLFKKKHDTPEDGFDRVVRASRAWPESLSIPLTFVARSNWSAEVQHFPAVHFLSPEFFYLAKFNARCVGTIHDLYPLDREKSADYSVRYRTFFRASLAHVRRLRGIVSVSNCSRLRLLARFPNLNVTVIHHWTTDRFRPRNKQSARAALGLESSTPIVLSIGSSAVQKNIIAIAETMNLLGPDFHLLRIGDSARLAKMLRYPSSATLLASVTEQDLPLYYNAADSLLFPSYDEGFGLPIVESINSGTPVIASDIPIFREILTENYPYFAPADSPGAQRELVERLSDPVSNSRAAEWLVERFGSYYRAERARSEYRNFYNRSLQP